jgi:acetylornithine deacetylase
MTPTARLLQDLVRRPSVNPMGRALAGDHLYEHQVTAYLEEFFRGLGVPWERQPVAPRRDNIVARYDPPGPPPFTLLLEVHQDTVPVDQMTIDPFGGEVVGGRLYGRGSCDVKAGMAAMLTAFARLVRERPAGSAAVVLACAVDEEHTFLGVQELARRGVRADLAVVAEPTNLRIVRAHKGVARWDVQTTGRACHSSRPAQGVNAVYRMGRVLTAIERYADELARSPAHPLLGPATLSVGRIEGGVSANTVPDACRIEVDRRMLPGETAAGAAADLDAYLGRAGFDFPFRVGPPWLSCPALGPEDVLVATADAVSAARPGARRETTETYIERLRSLEDIALGHRGVDKAYAIQAGREIRVMVQPSEVDDRIAAKLAYDISKQIESDLEYPGQIKVTVIRESRVSEVAR